MNKEELEGLLTKATANVEFDFEVGDEEISLIWTGGDSDTSFDLPRGKTAEDIRDAVMSIYDGYDFREEVMCHADSDTSPAIEDLVEEFQFVEDELAHLHDNLIIICNGKDINPKTIKWELSIVGEDGLKRSFSNLDSRCKRKIIRWIKSNYDSGTVEL